MIKDYVEFEATTEKIEYIDGEYVRTVEILPLHPCSDSDEFFEPIQRQTRTYLFFKMFSYCLPKPGNITVQGNTYTPTFKNLAVRLVRCTNRPTCKNLTEIDEFVNKNGEIVYF